ncbi:MAG: hypothetical protein ACM3ZC_10690 [Bacteroidota bacterium]
MKRGLPRTVAIALICLGAAAVQAAPLRFHARHVIRRTAAVVMAAQKAARRGGKYFGLARTVGHQLYARKQYARGSYLDAIYHSLRARTLAVQVIKLNGAALVREAALDRTEKNYAAKMPAEKDLDQKLEGEDLGTDENAAGILVETELD